MSTDRVPLAVDELTDRILALSEVTWINGDDEAGVPAAALGARFFYVGPDHRTLPFATLVTRDVPGWDEESRLDRPGVYRVNLPIGPEQFERQFGYPPGEVDAHRAAIDFARLDDLMPHPAYGGQGWVCILSPDRRRLEELDGLIRQAHGRALRRHHRREDRSG